MAERKASLLQAGPEVDPKFAEENRPFEIEKLLERRGEGDTATYLVKWKEHGNEHNVWYPVHALQQAKELMEECDARIAADLPRQRKQRGRPRKLLTMMTPPVDQQKAIAVVVPSRL